MNRGLQIMMVRMALAGTLSSCLKEELPVPARPRGDVTEVETCMGPGYQDQVWVDLGTRSVRSTNLKTAWDLAFESDPAGWHVLLNGSRLLTVWNCGQQDIALNTDTAGMYAARRIDAPSGALDSTAIGDPRATQDVFVVDLGFNNLGQSLGLRKIQFLEVTTERYLFRTAALDGSGLLEREVVKDPQRTCTMFSFATGTISIEPAAGTWDLVFTQYTHQFTDPFIPYLVTGVLTPPGVRVSRIPAADFASIVLTDTLAHPFSAQRNAIGYDWKFYSFDDGTYVVDPSLAYIVHDAEGFFHKLHFIDFYSALGVAGCPRWEVAGL
ncbi:MAG: HmuY family protein [Flavobacteriales bacterium]|nr:HmuY family protein [Flavobacteriales bacterium]